MSEAPIRARRHAAPPVVVAVLAAVALLVPAVGPAAAGAPVEVDGEPCTDGVGVTVVVDFQELGDDTVVVRCAPGPPTDGFAALAAAEVPYRTTITFPGFLCRLYEEPADDPCATASPADAYWSYWLAPAGGDWCYSNRGAGDRTPTPGSVEGWSFSLDRTSEDVPPPRIAPPPPPEGSDAAPLAGSDCGLGPVPGRGQTPAGVAPAEGDDRAAPAGTGVEGEDGEAVGRGGPVDLDAGGDSDGPVGTVLGVAAVVALAGAAGLLARRRRSHVTTVAAAPDPVAAPPDDLWRRPDDGRPASRPGRVLDEALPDVTAPAPPDGGDTGKPR